MRTEHFLKAGNLLPVIRGRITQDGNVIQLPPGTTVVFRMWLKETGVTRVEAAADIIDGTEGIVEYVWIAGDTDVAGEYEGEFDATLPGDTPITVPNAGYLKILISKKGAPLP